MEQKSKPEISFLGLPKFLSAAISIFIYIIASIGCVYANKWLLSNVGSCNGMIPLIQQLIGTVIIRISVLLHSLAGFSNNYSSDAKNEETIEDSTNKSWGITNQFRVFFERYQYIIPTAFCFSATIILNNACLSYAKLSTYSVAKSTTLIWNVLFQYLMLNISLPKTTVVSCFLIIAGVVVGSFDTSSLSPFAVIAGCSSSIFQALYNTFIARALPRTNNDTSEVLLRNQELSSLLLIFYVLGSGELLNLIKYSPAFDRTSTLFFACWAIFVLTTAFATLLNKFTFMVIGLTEPSTFSVIGFTKASLQTAGGWFIYHESKSVKSVSAVALTLSGSLIYGVSRSTKKTSNKSENIEQIRRLTQCSAASAGDIDVVDIKYEKKINDEEKKRLINSKV